MCLSEALPKLCQCRMHNNLARQVLRLAVLDTLATCSCQSWKHSEKAQEKVLSKWLVQAPLLTRRILPSSLNVHGFSHKLINIARNSNIKLVFPVPNTLGSLCRKTRPEGITNTVCEKKRHKNKFIECATSVVYCIPLTCGKNYIGQTGKCVNDSLRGS